MGVKCSVPFIGKTHKVVKYKPILSERNWPLDTKTWNEPQLEQMTKKKKSFVKWKPATSRNIQTWLKGFIFSCPLKEATESTAWQNVGFVEKNRMLWLPLFQRKWHLLYEPLKVKSGKTDGNGKVSQVETARFDIDVEYQGLTEYYLTDYYNRGFTHVYYLSELVVCLLYFRLTVLAGVSLSAAVTLSWLPSWDGAECRQVSALTAVQKPLHSFT